MKSFPAFLLCFLISVIVTTAQDRPNIVIIYADDLGYGDISDQNPESKITTANIDRLASQGMRFTDGHSSSGICSPSRYALLTGNYHWRRQHGIVGVFGKPFFQDGESTLASLLKDEGYVTGAIGKWHLGWDWRFVSKTTGDTVGWNEIKDQPDYISEYAIVQPVPGGPLARGFDSYYGDGTINFPPYAWVENDQFTEVPEIPLDLYGRETKEGNWEFRPGPMVEGWNPYEVLPSLTNRVTRWIDQQSAENPFFLYFALPSPHAPIIPNDEFLGKTGAGGYGDFVYQTDWVVGQVLDRLKENGFEENTLVIFTADNGPERYAFDRIRNTGHRSTRELRGLKRDTWEGGHRVPFIVRWPGKIKPGTVNAETISQVDIMATIADILDIKVPDGSGKDSYSLYKLWKGKKYRKPLREATVHNTFKDRYCLRQGDWLLVDNYSGEHSKSPDWYNEMNGYERYEEDNPGLLFNLKTDISQKNNLYQQYPEKVAQMQGILKKYREEGLSISR